jgi:hypothetical protein
MQLFQLIEAPTELLIAKTKPVLSADHMTPRWKNLSGQLFFGGQIFNLGKLALQAADLASTLWNQIDQGPHQKVPFRTKALPLPFVGNPLVSKNLEDLADLLRNLPGQAPALFALPKALVKVHVFTGTYLDSDCQRTWRSEIDAALCGREGLFRGVHGIGGLTGALGTGLLATKAVNSNLKDDLLAKLFLSQCAEVLVTLILSVVATAAFFPGELKRRVSPLCAPSDLAKQ